MRCISSGQKGGLVEVCAFGGRRGGGGGGGTPSHHPDSGQRGEGIQASTSVAIRVRRVAG